MISAIRRPSRRRFIRTTWRWLPALMTERLKKWQGNGARAVAAAVYGGRAYEDTLIELSDLLRGQGFRVMAAAALLAEHSIVHIAAGRPDEQDARQLGAFGRQIAAKLDRPAGGACRAGQPPL